MRRLARVAVPAALSLAMAVPASALGAPASASAVRVLLRASEPSGTVAVDSSSFHNDGVLKGGVGRLDGAYRFHHGYPHDRISVEAAPSLNPRSQPFSYSVSVRVPPEAIWQNNEMAVMRHGDSETAGGDYKMELQLSNRGTVTAMCGMHDGAGGSGFVQGDGQLTTIGDAQWHRLTCSRDPVAGTVSLTVDDVTVTRPDNNLGSIIGSDPLLIGAQPRRGGVGLREQFAGRMDNLQMPVGSDALPTTAQPTS